MAKKGVDIVIVLMAVLVVGAIGVFVFYGIKNPETVLGRPDIESIPEAPDQEEIYEGEAGHIFEEQVEILSKK